MTTSVLENFLCGIEQSTEHSRFECGGRGYICICGEKALIDLMGLMGVILAHISIFKCLPARIEPEWGYGDIRLVWNFFSH
jgi:hypothetical protein